MRDDLQFNINFVELIESKPCLYDYNRPDYSNRNAQDAAWNEISKTVKETVNDCKERWKNIRGSFTKYLNKKVPSGSSAKVPKPYYLAENLRFLQPFTKSRKPMGNASAVQDNVADCTEKNLSESDHELDASPEASPVNTRCDESAERNCPETLHITKKRKETQKNPTLQEVNASAFQYFQKKHEKLQECPEKNSEDPDMSFLRSLLPDMKKMTDYQKRKYKIGILTLAGEILEGSQSGFSGHQSSSSLNESSRGSSAMQQVYSPISLASPNPPNENIFPTYHSLQDLQSESEYTNIFPTHQQQQ